MWFSNQNQVFHYHFKGFSWFSSWDFLKLTSTSKFSNSKSKFSNSKSRFSNQKRDFQSQNVGFQIKIKFPLLIFQNFPPSSPWGFLNLISKSRFSNLKSMVSKSKFIFWNQSRDFQNKNCGFQIKIEFSKIIFKGAFSIYPLGFLKFDFKMNHKITH